MENTRSADVVQTPDTPTVRSDDGSVFDALQGPSALEQNIQASKPETEVIVVNPKRTFGAALRFYGLMAMALLLVSGAVLAFVQRAHRSQTQAGSTFDVMQLPLSKLTQGSITSGTTDSLRVNGRLQITSSLLLTPTSQPDTPIAGQLYYDNTSNKLAYFNGTAFITLGNASATTVSNFFGSGQTAPAVLLQNSSPGIQQTGSFTISGTGKVGTLRTSVIDSKGAALFINPTATSTASQQGGVNAKLGLATIGSTSTGGLGAINNVILATKATMGDVGGSLKSISVYLEGGSGAKHIQVGLYDDDGDLPSRPSTLLAMSSLAAITPNAFNTVTMPSIALTPNATYWLAFNTDDATVARTFNGGSKTSCFYGLNFGAMPDPFSATTCFFADETYTIYANYVTTSGSGGGFSKAHLSFSPTGQATFQNAQDSSTAFQVQNATGTTTVLNIDTATGRIAIGKATAAYRLDIAAGDINLNNGRSVRFNGIQALTMSSTGGTTSLSNFQTGGKVVTQADNFIVQDANGLHQSVLVDSSGAVKFSNRVNSATAFQIQNSTGTSFFTADSSGISISVAGSNTTYATLVLNNAHFKTTQTTPPAIGTPINCGTAPTANVSVDATDTAGSFSITSGTGGTSSTCDTVLTFHRTYGAAPKSIIVVGKTNAASVSRQIYVSSATATDFTISFGTSTGGADSVVYSFNYWVIE